ncbi:MAG: PqqD family protein [Paludibacter sp.]|jgi:mannitol-specific phosphotransferase system IIBC component|nr:PqqD family protein [Paludibacter sp.]
MYQLNKKKMFCDITDDCAIIINSDTGIYYGINSFGASVFQWIIEGSALSDILVELSKIPNVPTDMEQRLTTFIQDLQEKELIVEGQTIENKITINLDAAIKDKFIFKVLIFTDAQELLLSDPIHDAQEDIGWQPVLNVKK